jgi:hypothetical protein
MNMSEPARDLLRLFYKPEMIYLESMDYSEDLRTATSQFYIPQEHSYSCQDLRYVTAAQHLMCVSQIGYCLLGFLVDAEIKEFDFADFETFKKTMAGCQMYFGSINLHFGQNVLKGQRFSYQANLLRVRRTPGMIACKLQISGGSRGTITAVVPLIP